MNNLKQILYRHSWSQVKRLQSSSSSDSCIKIPRRIERGPTDILYALGQTVPKDVLSTSVKYYDDPFLIPTKKADYRIYALARESGKKTATWIFKQHADLFPNNLSDPKIEAFMPPVKYTDKSQVSEELLLDTISRCNASKSLEIYNLLEDNVSNETKQALLELFCYYNDTTYENEFFPDERFFMKKDYRKSWTHDPEIEKLYQFLITQDSATAALAYNTMLCAYGKWKQAGEVWSLYNKCLKEDIPLSITSFNYILASITQRIAGSAINHKTVIYSIFAAMTARGVYPNVITLNNTLKSVCSMVSASLARSVLNHLLKEFRRLNIKFSLGTYCYILQIICRGGDESYNSFMDTLRTMSKERFTLEHLSDTNCFAKVMEIISIRYVDRAAGDLLHKIVLTDDNYKFMMNAIYMNNYYSRYVTLILSTSTISEFYECYRNIVPMMYIPDNDVMTKIIVSLKSYSPEVVMEYLLKFWLDIKKHELTININLISTVIDLIHTVILPTNPPLTELFVEVALSCFNSIKNEMEKGNNSFGTAVMGQIALLLLYNDRMAEASQVLTMITKSFALFLPTMEETQLNTLFETCVSKGYMTQALLVLEICIIAEFEHAAELAKTLYSNPKLNDVHRDKLIELVGKAALDTLDK
ncbi:protein PTCD3 homolog, mitochondrial isoform X2 [Colletes gigas]|uniref:protein PTCD3 homolog, mitochondrial isoform X2 n=1 Tax=Colletes gigas TaxID=935657 RepID=UPI001C9B2239|nr:protein PTCD3 homolog, mitochondrial isoform X2 [Colletes gigas]